MGLRTKLVIVAPLVALSLPCAAADEDWGSLVDGRFNLELRPRYNRIEESDKPSLTRGGTARVVAGWRSAPLAGFRLTVEGIHAAHLGHESFNDDSSQLATSPYPLLPDPVHTGLNEAHVSYAGDEGLAVRLGRQLVRLGNQRWVSDNDFRQIPQLFDGVSAAYTGLPNTRLAAAHYTRVRTTSGLTRNLELTVLEAAFNPAAGHALAAYAVFHDQAQNGAFTGYADNSYQVAGVRAEGALAVGSAFEVPYVAEAARQRPYAGGNAAIKARYWRLGAGIAARESILRYDVEAKGSNAGRYGLQAPLTDFYGFNGWTLHFFNTPREGLRDAWLTARQAVGPFTLYAEWHRFRSDAGSLDFGREADIGLTYEALPNAIVRLQHARYDPGSGQLAPAIRKTWLTLTYNY